MSRLTTKYNLLKYESSINLNLFMGIRTIIAIFMGLVLQISQVQSCLGAEILNSSGKNSCKMSCCEAIQSCPCAKECDSNQTPVPAIPVSVDLKSHLTKSPDPSRIPHFTVPSVHTVALRCATNFTLTIYAGVPLSVAICRFII